MLLPVESIRRNLAAGSGSENGNGVDETGATKAPVHFRVWCRSEVAERFSVSRDSGRLLNFVTGLSTSDAAKVCSGSFPPNKNALPKIENPCRITPPRSARMAMI